MTIQEMLQLFLIYNKLSTRYDALDIGLKNKSPQVTVIGGDIMRSVLPFSEK